MKRFFSAALAAIALMLYASCTEDIPEKDPYGVFELTMSSAIGDIEISDLRITDGANLLIQNENAIQVNASGITKEFKVPEGTYSGVTLALAASDGRTGIFSLKKGADIAVNGGGRTKCRLEITSLKDNSAAEESVLPEGRMFNYAIKAMVRQNPDSLYCTYAQTDTIITSITFVNGSDADDGIRIDNFEGAPAYAHYDKATGAITISTSAKKYRMNEFPSSMFDHLEAVETIDFGNMVAPAVYKTERMFSYCRKLKAIDLSWMTNTAENSSMDNMFSYCGELEQLDIRHFNTSNVKHFRSLFNHCTSLKSIDVSNFDTSSAIIMTYMFQYASSLEKLDLSSFKVSHLEASKLNYFFYNMPSLKELRLADDFYASDKASPTSCFATTSLAYDNRIGSKNGGLTIYTSQASADWLATTTLRWINSGYNIKKPIPVTFLDNRTGAPLTVKWAAN